ncbi:hypothetical protein D7V97_02035 [Corallococcus sp. CA053C]|uniref:hypothetical protein n=1 Tax=Corallococcus sp. CA053C TaxID=2316732 RepID=UPI000EA332AC|nr:hypothetical protein [Corallococcus sp. CA053C]RKH14783.1 hypothetical protein D7V97_02035 [Corallococcus sp. CA053C]
MRITLSLLAVVVGVTFSAGCGGGYEPEQAPASESAPVEEQLPEGTVTQLAICTQKWTCNYVRWYSTEANCVAGCGGAACTKDYACTGGCLCP